MNVTQNKTVQIDASVDEFVASITHPTRRRDAAVLVDLFSMLLGMLQKCGAIASWDMVNIIIAMPQAAKVILATGFFTRKSNLSIYIMPGYGDFSDILQNLSKHKLGKSCLYVNKLADIDLDVLAQLITAGWNGWIRYGLSGQADWTNW